ncbi:MAG TPA: hypothetical protein VF306_15895 [Pirellulales bacterium]
MTRVVVDASLLAKLANLYQTVELCDAAGRSIGQFRPAILDDPALLPKISEEEMDRRVAAGGGRSLAEILTDLEKRA